MPPITCRPLPNSRRGESAPATRAATWDGRTGTPRQTIDSPAPRSQDEVKAAEGSVRKTGAVIDGAGELPGRPEARAPRRRHREHSAGRVPLAREAHGP